MDRFAHVIPVQMVVAVTLREMKVPQFLKACFPSKERLLVITDASVRVRGDR